MSRIPLGYIDLPSGAKAIYAMNDIFLNYTFEDESNWEAMRLIVNIFYKAYMHLAPHTVIKLIEGPICIRTQFKHILKGDNTTRDQDIKLTEEPGDITYIEFQNRSDTDPPIKTRAVTYFGLGIGHSNNQIANQVWLLAEDVAPVLRGKAIANYILKDEVDGVTYPDTSCMMFISLTQLSEEDGPVGELASVLLGRVTDVKDADVARVLQIINRSFDAFKVDKEVPGMLSRVERYLSEGRAEGRAEGEANNARKILELIEKGIDPVEYLREIASSATNPDAV